MVVIPLRVRHRPRPYSRASSGLLRSAPDCGRSLPRCAPGRRRAWPCTGWPASPAVQMRLPPGPSPGWSPGCREAALPLSARDMRLGPPTQDHSPTSHLLEFRMWWKCFAVHRTIEVPRCDQNCGPRESSRYDPARVIPMADRCKLSHHHDIRHGGNSALVNPSFKTQIQKTCYIYPKITASLRHVGHAREWNPRGSHIPPCWMHAFFATFKSVTQGERSAARLPDSAVAASRALLPDPWS
jgi:hypothetical protein